VWQGGIQVSRRTSRGRFVAWANTTDTTETGAYGIAIAAVEVTDGLVTVARAETRTGADYAIAVVVGFSSLTMVTEDVEME
jgi:hypothetical protein